MPRVHYVKKARKNHKKDGIKKGESYYWWKFNFRPRITSKTKPKPQQLTRSDYLITLLDISDIISGLNPESGAEAIAAEIDGIKETVEELKNQCEESLENMPEHLQDTSASGELLAERIEELESYYDELNGIDVDEEMDEEALGGAIEELQNVCL